MSRIVILCGKYLPNASPNGICASKVAEALKKCGHDISVIALNDVPDKKHSEEIINEIPVYRVYPGYLIKTLFDTEGKKDKASLRRRFAAQKVSSLKGALYAFSYPLKSLTAVKSYLRQIEKMQEEKPIDVVACCYHNIDEVYAGLKFKKKHPEVKLVVYTLDAISGGWVPNILHSAKIPMDSLKRWEKRIFKTADKMFAMESHRYYYEKNSEYDKYKEKIQYLDIPLLTPTELEKEAHEGAIKMVYTGSMHKASANPQYLLKLMPYIGNAEVYIYGSISPEIEKKIKQTAEFNKKIFIMGSVPYEKISEIQQNADVLLNFGNGNPNMIPCKIFEYMSTGNKILSFTYSPLDSSLPYIEKYPSGLIISEEDSLIEENAKRINEFLKAEIKKPKKDELKRLFEKNTPEYFEKCIGELYK